MVSWVTAESGHEHTESREDSRRRHFIPTLYLGSECLRLDSRTIRHLRPFGFRYLCCEWNSTPLVVSAECHFSIMVLILKSLERFCIRTIASTMTFLSRFISVGFAILVVGAVHAVDPRSNVQRLTVTGEDGHQPPELVNRPRCEVSADCDYGHICDDHLRRCTMGCKSSFDCFRGHTCVHGKCLTPHDTECAGYHIYCFEDIDCCSGNCRVEFWTLWRWCGHG